MMKRILLSGLVLAGLCPAAKAETQFFTTDELGEVGCVADNGQYAAITDTENNRAYLWSLSTGEFTEISAPLGTAAEPSRKRITGTTACDVTNDGMVVGSLWYADGHQVPAIYVGGEWTPLELHYAAKNTNEAVRVTPDGKTIAGYQFISDPSSEIGGRYYPVEWKLQDDGTYKLNAFTDAVMPDHQGFIPSALTPDGRVIGGMLYCGVGATVPALVVDGEFTTFDTFETKIEKWEFKGKWYCGKDEEGNQIWTSDPDDPRIVLFEEYYIDGYHDDGSLEFNGGFVNCDGYGNFYGMRTLVQPVEQEGENPDLSYNAAYYNVNTGKWFYSNEDTAFSAGIDADYILTTGNKVVVKGEYINVFDYFGFTSNRSLGYLNSYSADGRVIGGMTYEINPGSGQMQYFPIVLVLDEPLNKDAGVEEAGVAAGPEVTVAGGVISVAGASEVAIYDLQGRIAGRGARTSVAPGIYIVKADSLTAKVVVK